MGGLGFWSTGNPGGTGVQIGNSYIPPEGPKALPLALDFTINTAFQIQVSDLFSKGPGKPGFSVLQGFYADNSQSAAQLTVVISGTGQTLIVPAGSEGYIPMLSPSGGTIIFSSLGGNKLNIDLYNVPMPAILWNASATSFSFVSGGAAAGALKTSDIILDAIIAAGGGGTTVPVTIVGAGAGSSISNRVGGAFVANGNTNMGAPVVAPKVWGYHVVLSPLAHNGVGEENYITIGTTGGFVITSEYIYVPSAAPVLTQSDGGSPFSSHDFTVPIEFAGAQQFVFTWNGTTLTGGFIGAELYYGT